MDVEYLLTATPSARKSLDLDAPVDLADIRACLRIGLQAANGSNQQSWRWLVVTDPSLRAEIAGLYREAYLLRVGGHMLADLLPPAHRRVASCRRRSGWIEEHGPKRRRAAAGDPML